MKVAGYVRVSTEKQKEEKSHEKQEKELRNWADRNNHDIEIFRDIAISGQSKEREAYDELMKRLKEFDAVVVRELSRFGRSLKQVLQDVDLLQEKNVEFISLKEDMIDTTSAQGKAFLQMIGVFNEFWANLSRERTEEMIERRREEGKLVGRPKKLPEDKRKELMKDRKEKELSYTALAKIYEEYAEDGELSVATVRRYCQEGLEND